MRSAVPPFLGLQSPYDGRSDNAARSPCTPPPITRRLTPTIDRNISDGDLSTTEEWTSVLALATQWEFADYRRLAIARLSQLASPVDRILLGRCYDIPEWLSTAYLELCTRDDPLSYEEGERLGMRDVILLSDIRQSVRGPRVMMQDKNIAILIERRLG